MCQIVLTANFLLRYLTFVTENSYISTIFSRFLLIFGPLVLVCAIFFNTTFKKDYLKVPGKISALFLIFYSLFRFFIEFFRSPDPQIGYLVLNLTLGQLISILFFMTGTYLYP